MKQSPKTWTTTNTSNTSVAGYVNEYVVDHIDVSFTIAKPLIPPEYTLLMEGHEIDIATGEIVDGNS